MFSTIFKAFNEVSFSPLAQGLASIFGSDVFKFDKNQKRGPDGKWATQGVGAAGKLSIAQNKRDYDVDAVVLSALGGDHATLKRYNEAIAEVAADVRAGKSTNVMHSRNKDGTGGYTRARLKLHHQIMDHLLQNEADFKPNNPPPTFTILGGRGGSGKSNFDKKNARGTGQKFGVYDSRKALLIDPDAIKEMLPGYSPQKAYLFHEESAAIADKLHKIARDRGLNTVMDITMRSYHGAIMEKFKKAGYRTEAYFMHRKPELALRGAVNRWNRKSVVKNPLTGEAKVFPSGRLVPPSVVEANVDNEHNFDRMARMADHWEVVSNTASDGFSGKRIGSKPKPVQKLESFAVVLKANPYHDAEGKFTTKEKSASGTSEAYKIYAKAVSSVSGWEKGSDYNGEVRLVPLSKIDTQPDEVWSEEYRRGSGQKTIDYLKKEAFGTVYEGGQTVGSNKLEALLVRSTDSGRYQLVDGQHRYNLLKQIGSSVAGVQVIGAVQKSNPYHDELGRFTSKDRDSEHYSATREFTKEEIALLKGVKISSGSKLAEAMDNATDGHVDVQAIKATLAKGGKNYAQVEIPLSHIDWSSVTDEVAAVRADPNKGAILVGAHGEIVDGRHRSLLAKQSGDKTITAWVPVADALMILSKVQKAERILRPYELEPKSLESVQKSNPYHEPAGSPQGGQFTSKEKLGYRVATSVQFAAMLKDIGASSPHAPWLKQQALATNLKAKSHGALDLELAHDWLKAGHSKATINEVGIDLTDDDLKAMAHWQSKSKAAATSLKTLFDKHYTKHYAQEQDAIATFGPDSAQVKKLNKVGVSWLAQAYKFGASPQQVKEGLEGVEKAYKDAKAKKVAEDAFAPGKGPYATLPSTKHMAENNLATLKEYHGKVVSALGKDHPHAKAAESEVEMAQIHLDSLKSVAANVGAPATGGSSAPKFQSSKHLAGSLETYHALAEHYYKLKASGKDQSDPAVQAAHSEWEKSKEELKSKHGWGAPELSKEAKAVKDMVAGASMSSPGLDKLKQQEKTSLMGSLKKMYKAAELDGTPLDYDLEKKALALGVDQTDISQLAQTAKKEAIEEKKALKSNALNSAKSAAYNKAKALDLYGKDSPEYAEAVAAHVATVSANLKHASGSEFDFYSDTGEAAYATYKKDMEALKVKYGESLSKTMAEYATANFKDRKNSTELADHAAKVHSKLSAEQVAAIGSYTSSGFRQLNKEVGAAGTAVMKGQKPTFISDHRVKQMERMDDAFKDTTLGYDTKLYRNMAQKYFWEQLGISGNSMDAITDAQMNSVVGRVYKETAFSSTTTDVNLGLSLQDTALQSGRLTLNIRAGKKMPGMLVTAISSHSHENEVILPRGTTYVIKGIRRGVKGEKFIVDVDMIGAFPDKIN